MSLNERRALDEVSCDMRNLKSLKCGKTSLRYVIWASECARCAALKVM